MRRWPVLLVACGLFVACGSTGRVDGPDAGRAGAGDASPAAAGLFETDGPYRCCAPNAGTSCCGGVAPGMCFAYGGTYGDCRKAGEEYEGKVTCARCCPGLTRVNILVPGDRLPPATDQLPEGCDLGEAPVSIGVCVACGDGVCGAAENFCNCPEDCPRP